MEKKFAFTAIVKRVVTDDITLHVKADTEQEARDKAMEFLHIFPKASDIEGVTHAYIENREQNDGQVVYLEIEEDRGIA